MIKQRGVFVLALTLMCVASAPAQKKAPARKSAPSPAIRFQGAPQYSQDDLLAAAGLKSSARMSAAEVKAHAKELNDTGLFKEVKFSSDSKGLLFTLTPVTQLYPMHLDNLPVTLGKDFDAKLREKFPLYRGQLPASGSMVDGICRMLEEMLAAKGAKAIVKADLIGGVGPQKQTALNFSVTSPAVRIGHIQLAGVSPAMQPKVDGVASTQTGNSFDTDNSAAGLKHVFEDFYKDQGYAAVQVEVAQVDPLAVTAQAIDVPYAVTVKEGGVYKLGKIDYPAGALVPRSEVEKIASKKPVNSGRPLDLFLLSVRDAYGAKGYLDCAVDPHPSFNEAAHIVNYSLQIDPGPQYKFGSVKFEGAPDAMAAKLKAAWKVTPGDVFDASYPAGFLAQAQKKDKVLAKWVQSVTATYDTKADPEKHEVDCIFHFGKAAAPGAK